MAESSLPRMAPEKSAEIVWEAAVMHADAANAHFGAALLALRD